MLRKVCNKSIRGSKVQRKLRSGVTAIAAHNGLTTNKNSQFKTQKREFFEAALTPAVLSTGFTICGAAGFIAFAMYRYKVAHPYEYLVRTGLGIKDIAISKQGFLWPFQKYSYVNMHPNNHTFQLNSMSNEKIPFLLPGVFTIGPKNDMEALTKYVRILENSSREGDGKTMDSIILGILEGETRALSSKMTMEEIFNDRKLLKETIIKNVQEELDQIGLWIYNANIRELEDSADSKYFYNMRQKKLSEAENKAKVDVAEATKLGDIGKKEREATTRQQVAQYESETVLKENERKQEMEKSKAELAVVMAEAYRKTELAKIEAQKAAQLRETDLQREVEQKRVNMELEKQRAKELTKTQVEAESAIKEAEGKATALRLQAEAELYASQQRAEGIYATYKAQSDGVLKLIESFGGNKEALMQYLMLDKGQYEKLAKANAEAIRGLNPKLFIMGNQDDSGSYMKPISDILKMVPPLVSIVNDQINTKETKDDNNPLILESLKNNKIEKNTLTNGL